MVDIFGANIPTPEIDLTGFLSSSWIYVFFVSVIGLILVVSVALLLFYKTYNRKIVVFENIAGKGYQKSQTTRARIIKLGVGGEELLKTLAGGTYLSAYGRKMGRNLYWYAKGTDGYLYNVTLGDLDTKLNMLDIEPVDRDVKMFRVALDRLSNMTYGKTSFLEKYGVHMMLFLFLIVLMLGMWFIVGKVGEATSALANTAQTNEEVVASLNSILTANSNIQSGGGSGLIPATEIIPES